MNSYNIIEDYEALKTLLIDAFDLDDADINGECPITSEYIDGYDIEYDEWGYGEYEAWCTKCPMHCLIPSENLYMINDVMEWKFNYHPYDLK